MSKGNITQHHSGSGDNVAGDKTIINQGEISSKNLAETVAKIQELLENISQNYPTNTTTEQMVVATKVIEQIESNHNWKKKAIAAFKQGSLKAIETNAIGAFVVGAIKGWQG
ncbi:MAG TPA: hypothetical protein DCF68_11550 [Cyanothece sp. UBA12306]|nr:hypothetical protein [Cyanothece sp. UBA12306]